MTQAWYRVHINGQALLAPLTPEQLVRIQARHSVELAAPPADLAQRLGELIRGLAEDPPVRVDDTPVGVADCAFNRAQGVAALSTTPSGAPSPGAPSFLPGAGADITVRPGAPGHHGWHAGGDS